MKMGFFDEALVLVRSIGEIANLLALFASNSKALEEWKRFSRPERLSRFSPGRVRGLLGENAWMSDERYRLLCEVSTHPVPELQPQQFNEHGKSLTGGIHIQELGVIVVLNELAGAVCGVVLFSAILVGVSEGEREEIARDCETALETDGGTDITNYRDQLAVVRYMAKP
jgi:hypothetical protein